MPCRFVQIQIIRITVIGRRVGVVEGRDRFPPRLSCTQGRKKGAWSIQALLNPPSHVFIKKPMCILPLIAGNMAPFIGFPIFKVQGPIWV